MSPRILSISYNPLLLDVRQQLLERQGYEVVSVDNLVAALEHCREGGYDIVVMGHSLPPKDKEIVFTTLRANCPARVISVSLEAEHDVRTASAWVDPFEPNELLKAVNVLTKAGA